MSSARAFGHSQEQLLPGAPGEEKLLSIKELDPKDGKNRYRVSSSSQGLRLLSKEGLKPKRKSTISSRFIHWTLQTPPLLLLSTFIFMVAVLTFLFAFVIMGITKINPTCVTSNIFHGHNSFQSKLNDAWQLSWSTFSTVGYGMISPATSSLFNDDMERFRKQHRCAFMGFMLSFECLLGILYISLASAIIFGRLTQFQNNAQVKFSSVLLVRYGEGARNVFNQDSCSFSSSSSDGDDEDDEDDDLPCPVLIFRIANLLNSPTSRQIFSASINAVATVDVKNSMIDMPVSLEKQRRHALQSSRILMNPSGFNPLHSSSFHPMNALNPAIQGIKKIVKIPSPDNLKKVVKLPPGGSKEKDENPSAQATDDTSLKDKRAEFLNSNGKLAAKDDTKERSLLAQSMLIVDGLSHDINAQDDVANLVFANIPITPNVHPYFTTTWRVMHELNENSPLLSKALRKEIKENKGHWPADKSHEKAVTDAIDFDQLMICFSGMSAATCSEVSHNHVYEKKDMKVGYQFKSILMNSNGTLYVKPGDIDEIKLQDARRKCAHSGHSSHSNSGLQDGMLS